MKQVRIFLFISFVIFGSACAHTAKNPELDHASQKVRQMEWHEIKPYVKRHIGMRPKTADVEAFSFDIGGEFAPFEKGMDPQIDTWVADALRKNHGLVASTLIDLVIGTQDYAERDAHGKPIAYPEEKIREFAHRLWVKVENQKPPVAMTHLKFLLARELRGKVQIAGIDLKPTLSQQQEITWRQLEPYILGFIRVAEHPTRLNNKEKRYELGFRVCMTDNHVFQGINPEKMDWNIAMAVFESMASEMGSGSVFTDRLSKNLEKILAEEQISLSDFNRQDFNQREEWLKSWEGKLHDRLREDPVFWYTVRGFVMNYFEDQNLPPIV